MLSLLLGALPAELHIRGIAVADVGGFEPPPSQLTSKYDNTTAPGKFSVSVSFECGELFKYSVLITLYSL